MVPEYFVNIINKCIIEIAFGNVVKVLILIFTDAFYKLAYSVNMNLIKMPSWKKSPIC